MQEELLHPLRHEVNLKYPNSLSYAKSSRPWYRFGLSF